MSSSRPKVCVIGGGISGLAAAYELVSSGGAVDVALLEASDRVGGAIRTDVMEGLDVEAGADSFLARAPDAVELCKSLGLEDELIAPAVFGGSILTSASPPSLVGLPPGFVFGMPSTRRAALTARHLPLSGRVRAALEPIVPGRPITTDVSIGELVRRRYGRSVLEWSVDPLLAGTRAGRVDEMSLEAALPQIWQLLRGRRSVMRALAGARARNGLPEGPPPFKTVAGGLQRMVDALTDRLRSADVRVGTRVQTIERAGDKTLVRTENDTLEFDAVIAATPSYATAAMLRLANPVGAELLRSIEFASVATITFVFPPGARRKPLPGSGMLVPVRLGLALSASTWYSIKWPHAAPADGGLVVRSFVGRATGEDAWERPDDELVEGAAAETAAALELTQAPLSAHLVRWPRSLPQYRVGHVRLVERIEEALLSTPGIWVSGASYGGSGIPDCIRHARATARRVLHSVGAVG